MVVMASHFGVSVGAEIVPPTLRCVVTNLAEGRRSLAEVVYGSAPYALHVGGQAFPVAQCLTLAKDMADFYQYVCVFVTGKASLKCPHSAAMNSSPPGARQASVVPSFLPENGKHAAPNLAIQRQRASMPPSLCA